MELPLSPTTLLVLAGGASKRLSGRAKPLARNAEGRTLVDTIAATLGPLADEILIVAPAAHHAALAATTTIELVDDPGLGPARAVYAGAAVAKGDRLLVVGGDVVAPSPDDARSLLAALDEVRAAVLVDGGRWQPMLCALSRAAVCAVAAPRSMYGLVEALEAREVPATKPLEDVDTPEDLARHGLVLE